MSGLDLQVNYKDDGKRKMDSETIFMQSKILSAILAIIALQVHTFLSRQLYRLLVEVWSSGFSA